MYFGFSKWETKINIQCLAVEYPVEIKEKTVTIGLKL